MSAPLLHRFEVDGRCFAMDTRSCFCFECDRISWDVLAHYPREPVNRIYHLLRDTHPRKDLEEVVGELEWLRVTRAILATPGESEIASSMETSPGIARITVAPATQPAVVAAAGHALLALGGERQEQTLILAWSDDGTARPAEIAEALEETRRAAAFAGKTLWIGIEHALGKGASLAPPLNDHDYRCRVLLKPDADIALALGNVAEARAAKWARVDPLLRRGMEPQSITAIVRPGTEHFEGVVKTLYESGFRCIELDLPSAYAACATLDPGMMAASLRANLRYYAEQLSRGCYFQVEPLATQFKAIHIGKPLHRVDMSGYAELAVDGEGRVFPSPDYLGNDAYVAGNIVAGQLDGAVLEPFKYLGALQTPVCLRCWAACLCGGGHGVVHLARTGAPHSPDPVWCDAQRDLMPHVIAAFNTVSASGVDFSYIEAAMQPRATNKRSWRTMIGAALQQRLAARPLREEDASWLVRWENWNPAAYFLCGESGLMLATRYDREMDALHPRGDAVELVLVQGSGRPLGLLKVRPMNGTGTAWVWLYLRDQSEYAQGGMRKRLRGLLEETIRNQRLRRVLIPVTRHETELAQCLESINCTKAAVLRQALYLHGAYHDVDVYCRELP